MIHTSCFNIRPEVAGHSLTDAGSFKKILKLWCALVMAKFFCSCERASARQNVSPEGREGGEDTGVCGNIFQSRLSLESAQKSRHRILGKIQTHFLKTCMDWTFLFYKSSSLFFHSPSPSSAAKESWECAELWKRLHRLEPEFGCGNTQQQSLSEHLILTRIRHYTTTHNKQHTSTHNNNSHPHQNNGF